VVLDVAPYLLTDVIPGVGKSGKPEAIAAHWEKVKKQRTKMFAKMARLSFKTDRRSTLLALADECGFPRDLIRERTCTTWDRWCMRGEMSTPQ